jgi:hypothetical protein
MTAISAFAKSAPTTASIHDSFSQEIIALLDYREKIEAWQWRFGYEFVPMKPQMSSANGAEDAE